MDAWMVGKGNGGMWGMNTVMTKFWNGLFVERGA